jgi:hypothetical protein
VFSPASRAAFSSPTTSDTKRMSGGSSPTSVAIRR